MSNPYKDPILLVFDFSLTSIMISVAEELTLQLQELDQVSDSARSGSGEVFTEETE